MNRARFLPTVALAALLVPALGRAQQPDPGVEGMSLMGEPLRAPELAPERRARLEADLAKARADLDADPGSEDAAVWVGRRLAYLGRYRDAIAMFSQGLERHPKSAALLRHRGHRYITLRQFDKAIADLEMAGTLIEGAPDRVEPDGAPNPAGIARSTLHTNVWYHLGLARFLKGEWGPAADAYARCLAAAPNDDMRVAASHWLYLSLRRDGRDEQARKVLEPVAETMDVIENQAYHKLLLLYKGLVRPERIVPDAAGATQTDAALTYGVGAWLGLEGKPDHSRAMLERTQLAGPWPAFGVIAAEAELARLEGP
ncbi:MAG: hypothetical protein FJ255_11280 [Phycisphaerae bacterium]|nr:hypothetical protein [Phycisphaerae bacterium]